MGGSENTIQISVILDDRASSAIEALNSKLASIGSGSRSSFASASESASGLEGAIGAIAIRAVEAVAAIVSINTAVEAIKGADQIRDLAASISAVSQGTIVGSDALKFFDQAAQQTRATATQLATVFRDDLPLAISHGLSPEYFEQFTVTLAQFATAVGQNVSTIGDAFKQILGGRVTGTNPILAAIGISRQDVTQQGVYMDEIVSKIQSIAAAAPAMGVSFESVFAHIKDSLSSDFADGFNSAGASAQKGYQAILQTLDSPAIRAAVADIGSAIAEIVPLVAKSAVLALDVALGAFEGVKAGAHQTVAIVDSIMAGIADIAKVGIVGIAQGKTSPLGDTLREMASEQLDIATTSANKATAAFASMHAALDGTATSVKSYGADLSLIIAPHIQLGAALNGVSNNALSEQRSIDDLIAGINKLGEVKPEDPLAAMLAEIDSQFADAQQKLERKAEDLQASLSAAFGDQSKIKAYQDAIDATTANLSKMDTQTKAAAQSTIAFYQSQIQALSGTADPARIAQLTQDLEKVKLELADLPGLEQQVTDGKMEAYFDKVSQSIQKMADSADEQLDKLKQKLTDALVALPGSSSVITQIQQIGDQAKAAIAQVQALATMSGTSTPGTFGLMSMTPEQLKAWNDSIIQTATDAGNQLKSGFIDSARALGDELKKQIEEATSSLSHDFQSLFDALVSGGGTKSFETALQSIAKEAGKDFGKEATSAIEGILGIQGPQAGNYSTWGGPFANFQQANQAYQGSDQQAGDAQTNKYIAAGIQGLAGLAGIATTPGMTVGGGALEGAAMGSSFTWVGAVIGAVLGAIAGAIAPSKSQNYQYGEPEYSPYGGWKLVGTKNLSQDQIDQYLQQLQTAMDTYNDGFVKIIAAFPVNLMAAAAQVLTQTEGVMTGLSAGHADEGGSQYGTIGGAASSQWAQEMSTYISEGLPEAIEGAFRNVLSTGFQSIGFSGQGANALLNEAQTMAPTDALTFLSTIQQAIEEFNKVIPNLSQSFLPSSTSNTAFSSGGQGSIWQQAWEQTNQSFAASLADSQTQMLQLAAAIPLLSGTDQANAIKQLADLNTQRYQAEIAFAQQLQAAILNMSRSFDADIRSKTLAGMKTAAGTPDYGSQENYLNTYLQKLEGQAGQATTVDQLNYLQQQIQATIDQMVSIADNSGNAGMAAKYDNWAIHGGTSGQGALGDAEAFLNGLYTKLGDGVDSLNAQLLAAENPFITALLNGTTALDNFNGSLPGSKGGGGGGGSPAGGGKDANGDSGTSGGGGASGTGITPIDLTNLADAINSPAKLNADAIIAAINAAAVGQSGGDPIVLNLTVMPTVDGFQQSLKIARQG